MEQALVALFIIGISTLTTVSVSALIVIANKRSA